MFTPGKHTVEKRINSCKLSLDFHNYVTHTTTTVKCPISLIFHFNTHACARAHTHTHTLRLCYLHIYSVGKSPPEALWSLYKVGKGPSRNVQISAFPDMWPFVYLLSLMTCLFPPVGNVSCLNCRQQYACNIWIFFLMRCPQENKYRFLSIEARREVYQLTLGSASVKGR